MRPVAKKNKSFKKKENEVFSDEQDQRVDRTFSKSNKYNIIKI